jgi:Carboxypeptidase regulatory-like domain
VSVLLESDLKPSQTATAGSSGSFRFANLPPGTYTVLFELQGFTKIEQENVKVSTGSEVQLQIIMKPSVTEELTVIGETPLLNSRKTGLSASYHREHLDEVPTARDPWSVIQQTPGIDSDRNNVTEQGVQSLFATRGSFRGAYSYDGVNITDA